MITKIISSCSDDFRLMTAFGNVPGYQTDFMIGVQDDLDTADGNITIWDCKFDYTPFTADTEIFISSSDAADTQYIRIIGLDSNFNKKVSDVALNGQNQVSIGNFRHIQVATVVSASTPAGDVYIAASDTLTAGVPDTDSKVKSKILQGKNITHNGFFMIPKGKTVAITAVHASTDSASKSVIVQTWITSYGGSAMNLATYTVLSGFQQFSFSAPFNTLASLGLIPERTLIHFKGFAATINTQIFFGMDLIIIDKALTELA